MDYSILSYEQLLEVNGAIGSCSGGSAGAGSSCGGGGYSSPSSSSSGAGSSISSSSNCSGGGITATDRIEAAITRIGEKKYVVGSYQCDEYFADVL